MRQFKELRIFVASPSDCQGERDTVRRVAHDLEKFARDCGYTLEVISWENIPPIIGVDAQQAIDTQLGEYNILVGIMWLRFGSAVENGAQSGTEHEVERAAEAWKKYGTPRVMFYFNRTLPSDLDFDAAQLAKVQKFRKLLFEKGLIQDFTDDFRDKLYDHLYDVIKSLNQQPDLSMPVTTVSRPKQKVTWAKYLEAIQEIKSMVSTDLAVGGFRPELIIAISRGGAVAGDLLSRELNDLPMITLWAARNYQQSHKEVCYGPPNTFSCHDFPKIFLESKIRRVLLVDDFCKRGTSLSEARKFVLSSLPNRLKTEVTIKTAVIAKEARFDVERCIKLDYCIFENEEELPYGRG